MNLIQLLALSFPFELPSRYTRLGVFVRWLLWLTRAAVACGCWAVAAALYAVAAVVGAVGAVAAVVAGLTGLACALVLVGAPVALWQMGQRARSLARRVAAPPVLTVVMDVLGGVRLRS